MMICIEMLEAENLQLRERLDANKPANSETPSEPDETSSEGPAQAQPAHSADEDVAEIDDADIEAILASVANEGAEDAA